MNEIQQLKQMLATLRKLAALSSYSGSWLAAEEALRLLIVQCEAQQLAKRKQS